MEKVIITEVIVSTAILLNMAIFLVHASPPSVPTRLQRLLRDPFSTAMYKIGSPKQAVVVPVKIQSQSLLMEIDTGANTSVISQ